MTNTVEWYCEPSNNVSERKCFTSEIDALVYAVSVPKYKQNITVGYIGIEGDQPLYWGENLETAINAKIIPK